MSSGSLWWGAEAQSPPPGGGWGLQLLSPTLMGNDLAGPHSTFSVLSLFVFYLLLYCWVLTASRTFSSRCQRGYRLFAVGFVAVAALRGTRAQ